MILRHAALRCSSEENSDKFYKDLLGLDKSEPKTLPQALSKAIFNLDSEMEIINYRDLFGGIKKSDQDKINSASLR